MDKKEEISFERHQEIGAELSRIDHYLTLLSKDLFNTYGMAGVKGKAYKEVRKAVHSVTAARSLMEGNFVKDYPDRATPDVYYPEQSTHHFYPGKK